MLNRQCKGATSDITAFGADIQHEPIGFRFEVGSPFVIQPQLLLNANVPGVVSNHKSAHKIRFTPECLRQR